jgi:RNA polymerase sigma factor (TIGR02999 family)
MGRRFCGTKPTWRRRDGAFCETESQQLATERSQISESDKREQQFKIQSHAWRDPPFGAQVAARFRLQGSGEARFGGWHFLLSDWEAGRNKAHSARIWWWQVFFFGYDMKNPMADEGDAYDNPPDRKRKQALDELFSIAYDELRCLAASVRYSGPNAGISTSTLVSEAWLKLVNSANLEPTSKLHFMCVAARAMRQIVLDTARRQGAAKRAAFLVTLDDSVASALPYNRDLLALDAALEELERQDPRQAQLVELRFFGGLQFNEITTALNVSESTAQREWRVAKAWLKGKIRKEA